ncbi:MAG: Xaa-Pro peptidase family protein [Candidatus Aenigmatarchaeota archaeon]
MTPDFSRRVKKLQKEMSTDKILITNSKNIYYYTGHKASEEDPCFLIINSSGRPHLFVSPLVNDAKMLKTARVSFISRGFLKNELRKKSVSFEEDHLITHIYTNLKKHGIKFKPADKIINKPRHIKDAYELDQLKNSINLVKKTLDGLGNITGKTEKEISNKVRMSFVKANTTNSFDTIVSTGSNGEFIHHTPSNKMIKKGDLTVVDMGAKMNMYCSDITRTFHSGVNTQKRKIYEDVLEIQRKIIDVIEPGMTFESVQGMYINMMTSRGYKVMHGISHGIGLDVHEPFDVLEENMVITVEPGVYKNIGGCRIEDMVLIKKDKVKILSDSIRLS